jgi:hypothetical protein
LVCSKNQRIVSSIYASKGYIHHGLAHEIPDAPFTLLRRLRDGRETSSLLLLMVLVRIDILLTPLLLLLRLSRRRLIVPVIVVVNAQSVEEAFHAVRCLYSWQREERCDADKNKSEEKCRTEHDGEVDDGQDGQCDVDVDVDASQMLMIVN